MLAGLHILSNPLLNKNTSRFCDRPEAAAAALGSKAAIHQELHKNDKYYDAVRDAFLEVNTREGMIAPAFVELRTRFKRAVARKSS
jgi:hypothetical protein